MDETLPQVEEVKTVAIDGKEYRVLGCDAPEQLRKVLDNLPEPVTYFRGDGEICDFVTPIIGLENMVEVLNACYAELVRCGGQIEDIIAAALYKPMMALDAYVRAEQSYSACRDEFNKHLGL